MIKKLIKGIMILCGSIVFSVAIVGCKPTTILADNTPVLKSARPTPKKVSVNDFDIDTVYTFVDYVDFGGYPSPASLTLNGFSYDHGHDPNDLDEPTYDINIQFGTGGNNNYTFGIGGDSWNWEFALYTSNSNLDDGYYLDDGAAYYGNYYIIFHSLPSDPSTLNNFYDYVLPCLVEYDPNPRYALYVDNNFVADVFVNTRLQVETQALNNAGNFGRQITGIRDLSTLQMIYTFNSSGYKFLEGFTKSGTTNVIYGDFYVFVMTGPLYLNTKVINMANTYNNVYQNGYDDGYDGGELDGYNDGYQDGLNDNTAYELGLADSGRNVLANGWQAIISMVDSFFNVQIFPGFKVIYLVYISLGLLILGFAFKIFVH